MWLHLVVRVDAWIGKPAGKVTTIFQGVILTHFSLSFTIRSYFWSWNVCNCTHCKIHEQELLSMFERHLYGFLFWPDILTFQNIKKMSLNLIMYHDSSHTILSEFIEMLTLKWCVFGDFIYHHKKFQLSNFRRYRCKREKYVHLYIQIIIWSIWYAIWLKYRC